MNARSLLVPVLLCGSTLAGCVGAPSDSPPGASSAPPAWPFAFEATCDDFTIGFLEDLERLRRLLPRGFVPADAAAFVSSPAPTGKGVLAVTTVECAESSITSGSLGEAEVAVLVEPPTVARADVEEGALFTTYMAAVYVSSKAYHARVSPWGHDVVLASVSNAIPDPAQGGVATITISDAQGEVARFEAALAVPEPQPTSRGFTSNWQATADGLLHYRIDLAPRAFTDGTPLACTIREGSRMHELLGFRDCSGRAALAVGARGDPYRAAWTWFEGASVREGDPR